MILRCNRHCYWLLQLSVLVLFACTATRSRWAVSATTFCQDVIQPFQHYDCSERTVNTNDGFGLTLEHITPKNHYGAYAGHVLFFHTVFLGGEQWFLSNLPTPFALADGNYSVWVANMRTTPYGRGCSYYDVTQMGYWDWCGDEMVNYDFPVLVNYVVNAIGDQQIHLVGFSHGARVVVGALTYQFRQAQMLLSVTLIAPVVYTNNTQAPVLVSIKQASFTAKAYTTVPNFCLRIFSGLANNGMTEPWLTWFMDNAVTSLTGRNCCTDTKAVFQAFTRTNDSCTSFKLLDHLYQGMTEGLFYTYEYHNATRSMQVYGNIFAHPYEMDDIPANIPVLVIYGGADTFAEPIDVERLIRIFGVDPEVHFLPSYAHADFLFSNRMQQDVNARILQFLVEHTVDYCDRVRCFSRDVMFANPSGVYLPSFPPSLLSLTNLNLPGFLGALGVR